MIAAKRFEDRHGFRRERAETPQPPRRLLADARVAVAEPPQVRAQQFLVEGLDAAGTDHGTAGPRFLAGPSVKSGLVGAMPKLLDPDPKHGDLRVGLDFRRVYATVLEDWLGLPAKVALGGSFDKLSLFPA
jgi:hypothetical protein